MPTASVITDVRDALGRVHRHIYGHFIEHLRRCIYGGVWVGEGSSLPNVRGFRKDVLDLTRALRPPIVRWPGGNFASGYHWEDGVGPRAQRPVKWDRAWNAEEPNEFGTDEFIAWCREVGTEPYICVNTGSAPPEEAANWVEYCNKKGRTKYAALRAANGNAEPFGVKYWGIGNEVYGGWQIGAVDAATYAKQVIEFSKQMRAVDPTIKLVAVGCESEAWNCEVLRTAGEYVDYISLHRYYHHDDYYESVACPLDAERRLRHLGYLIDAVMASKRKRRVEIAFDEWNVWYKEATGQSGFTQHLALRDGIFAAGMFHVFHRLCASVTMANLAQLVNVLPAIVTDDQGRCYANPIYLAFKLYGDHTGEIALRTRTESPAYKAEKVAPDPVPYLDCSATMSADGKKLFLAVVNRHKEEAINCRFEIIGATPAGQGKQFVLNAESVEAKNDFDRPSAIQIQESSAEGVHNFFSRDFPAHSATIVEVQLR